MSLDEAVSEYKAAVQARAAKRGVKETKEEAAAQAQRDAEDAGFDYEASKSEVDNAKAALVQAAEDLAAE